nr:Hsp20/alpha crystallin family protein [Paludibacter sp.]
AVELAAPGFEKADFKIELNRNLLTISSDKKLETETNEGEVFTKREFSYQSFSRSFTLPQIADGDRIEANYANGILTVIIPKREEAKPKPARTIEIN